MSKKFELVATSISVVAFVLTVWFCWALAIKPAGAAPPEKKAPQHVQTHYALTTFYYPTTHRTAYGHSSSARWAATNDFESFPVGARVVPYAYLHDGKWVALSQDQKRLLTRMIDDKMGPRHRREIHNPRRHMSLPSRGTTRLLRIQRIDLCIARSRLTPKLKVVSGKICKYRVIR